ncbi:McrB family protein [Mariprofundus ferrooxydans]|uniref:McrB family protein n=1 Tax=Mariprofundus ferrooxydans TaxID=314344 RepID=UPI000360811C|nr:AAA family ATPase [Mariprofundus ferrooxydans]
MSFQDFCEDISKADHQRVSTNESFVISYSNRSNEMFSIDPFDVKKFIEFLVANYSDVEDIWSSIPSRKQSITNYEEKSYRAIYKLAGKSDDLNVKAVSTTGGSQTLALTQIISKLICYLIDKEYSRVQENTFFDIDSLKTVMDKWPSDMLETLRGPKPMQLTSGNMKQAFKVWMKNEGLSQRTINSYAETGISVCQQYLERDQVLSGDLYASSVDEIDSFIQVLNNNQEWSLKNQTGNQMYSSAIRKYKEFLLTRTIISSRLSKPFLLLAGISGTGKTRFVREQAQRFDGIDNYCLVSVRPDWHEPSDLLGYISRMGGSAEYVCTDVLRFMVSAWKHLITGIGNKSGTLVWDGRLLKDVAPFWLCLDEMNLAPVEQYFADYLSIVETRRWYSSAELAEFNQTNGSDEEYAYECDPLLKPDVIAQLNDKGKGLMAQNLGLELSNPAESDIWDYFCQNGISIPFNLIVAGTVNMDETTHGFSRKVIDRALTVDFGEFFPNDFGQFFSPTARPLTLSYPVWSDGRDVEALATTIDPYGSKSNAFLTAINDVLGGTPFMLAYRALNELLLSVIAAQPQSEDALFAIWDDFMMTKVLPRIEGDADKLGSRNAAADNLMGNETVLDQLLLLLAAQLKPVWDGNERPDLYREYISDINGSKTIRIECRSKAKLAWMKDRLERATFTSFWP